jgi:biopolymer transport protein ExbD
MRNIISVFSHRFLKKPLALLALALAAQGFGSVALGQAAPQVQAPSTRIILTLTEDRVPSINGQVVPWKELDPQLRAIYTGRPQRTLYIRAHPNNDYKAIKRVVDLAKRRGITVQFLPYAAS